MQRMLLPFATIFVCLFSLLQPGSTLAQQVSAPGTLTGVVADPNGGRIPGAILELAGKAGKRSVATDNVGHFSIRLPAGSYALTVTASGFVTLQKNDVTVPSGGRADLPLTLAINAESTEVNVNAGDEDSTDEANNRSALSLSGATLATLSDDESTFQQQIQAMAGGGDSGNTQLYVDGFSGGRFPPKSSIREIRINSNPFSAEYDTLGFGRIEIFTKPGADKLHGWFDLAATANPFNARNPYTTGFQPGYHDLYFDGNLNGPIGKKTSFFVAGNRIDQQNNTVVNAVTLDTNNNSVPYSAAVPDPNTSNTGSFRLDRQVTPNNVLTARYEYNNSAEANSGVGLLVLPSEGLTTSTTTNTVQLSDSETLGASTVIETRFEYIRTRMRQSPNSTAPTLVVEGSFNGGGSPAQLSDDNQDHYELQEYVSRVLGHHLLRFGGRLRDNREANTSTGGYNGAFTFPSLAAYQLTLQGLATGMSPAAIRAEGGGASQFNLTAGLPSASLSTVDFSLYAEDEWKLNKDLTLDYGFRAEGQSAIPDHFDPAPRIGLAYAITPGKRKQPLAVVRAGFGMFYFRFGVGNLLTAVRQNGTSQLAYFVEDPDFYPQIPTPAGLPSTEPTVYRVSPTLRIPYDLVGSLSVEHSFGSKGNVSATWVSSRRDHGLLSRNINAPLPGTYNPDDPTSGVRPLGGTQNIYEFESEGNQRAQSFFTHLFLQPTKLFGMWAFYGAQQREADTSGAGSFPSDQYNLGLDYGRLAINTQRFFGGAWYSGPADTNLEVFLATRSGTPFNITTGTDLNGDTIFNDRPSFATDLSRPSVVRSAYGNFDTDPIPGQTIIPINYGTSPAFVSLQVSFSKSVGFGPRAAAEGPPPGAPAPKGKVPPPESRYHLRLGLEVQNVLNHNNPGVPVGILTSPYFGKSLSLANGFNSVTAANRTIDLHTTFNF